MKRRDPMREQRRLISFLAVLVVLTELGGAAFTTLGAGPGVPSSSPYSNYYPVSHPAAAPVAGPSLPGGQRIGFWVQDDDIFTTSGPYGASVSPSVFFNDYFMTTPYPAAMLWVSGLVSSASASVPSTTEAAWLSQVATLADAYPSIKILMLLFVNLSGNSIVVIQPSHSATFNVKRTGSLGLTNFTATGLTPGTGYTIALPAQNGASAATIGTATTDSKGRFSVALAIPNEALATNEPGVNLLWNIVVQGTSLSSTVALQCDQTTQLTNYMSILKGHSSIFGVLFEPEYFGDTPAIRATFRSIITGAGYQNLQGQSNSQGDPILYYSSYPYFGGQLQTAPSSGAIGVHYGETGAPISPDPQPIWTQATVLNIVDHSAPLPVTIIISEADANNPIGNSFLWANPTLRGWIAADSNYQSNFLTSTSSVPATSTTSTSSTSSSQSTGPVTSTITTTIPPAGGIDISFSSYSTPFNYGQNFQSAGNSFPIQVPRPIEANMIAFYFSDRAYDPNPVPFTITDPSNNVLATGTIPALLQFASQQYYPIQLSQMVTMQPGVTYTVKFASLPPGDTYGTSGISQDMLQEAASSPGTGYLGQSQWPIFELGLMNILSQSQGLAYHNYGAYTDLFSSPGYQSTGEIAMRFQPSQSEQLVSFEVNIWKSDTSSNQLVFTLRSDAGGHPSTASSALATASLTAAQIQNNLTATNSFVKVVFSSRPQLQAGTYYWIVASAPANAQDVVFGRLVNPYREYVLYSTNDFASSWGVPPDGPTDLGFRITTTSESIVNTVASSSQNNYFSGAAQSFVPSTSAQVKGAWVSAKPAGENMIVSIQTDNGNDQPSGNILAQGSDPILTQFTGGSQDFVYVGFSSYAAVSSGTKYWLVVTIGPCLSSSCSNPSTVSTLQYRADYSASGYGPQNGVHYELLQGSWQSPSPAGTFNFALVSPTGNEGDPIWGSQTTTYTTTIQPTTQSSTSSTTTSTTTTSSTSTSSSTTSTTSSSTTTTSQTSSTSTSTSFSTTSFLSSSSSYSSSSFSPPPSTSSTTVASSTQPPETSSTYTGVTTSTVTGQTTLPSTSTTWTPPSTTSTTASSSASQTTTTPVAASTSQAPPSTTVSASASQSTPGAPAPSLAATTETSAGSPSTSGASGSGSSAVLYPSTSSLMMFSGTMGLLVVGLAVGVKLRSYRALRTRRARD